MMHDDRPLSPHLTRYKPQLTSSLSILHRLTGLALVLGLVMLVFWIGAVAAGGAAYETAEAFFSSWFGVLVLMASTAALAYHLLNGVRHLLWDVGIGLELHQAYASGWLVGALALMATAVAWFLIFFGGQ